MDDDVLRYVQLLNADHELAAAVPSAERDRAKHLLMSAAYELPTGRFDAWKLRAGALRPLGLLVRNGLLGRRMPFGDLISTQLFVPGDICRPWKTGPTVAAGVVEWFACCPTEVVVIDERVRAYARRWPQLLTVLYDRLHDQLDDSAAANVLLASPQLERRLLLVLWQLARRAGHATEQGMEVELPLTDALLGQLVAAQRSAVADALGELVASGRIRRDGDRWQLIGGSSPDFMR